jgi:pyrroline-5-carboxylate reductase
MEAGVSCGLPEGTCRELLLQTLEGAAKMLKETGKAPAELRRQVTFAQWYDSGRHECVGRRRSP